MSQIDRLRAALPGAEFRKIATGTWIVTQGDELYLRIQELQIQQGQHPGYSGTFKNMTARPGVDD